MSTRSLFSNALNFGALSAFSNFFGPRRAFSLSFPFLYYKHPAFSLFSVQAKMANGETKGLPYGADYAKTSRSKCKDKECDTEINAVSCFVVDFEWILIAAGRFG